MTKINSKFESVRASRGSGRTVVPRSATRAVGKAAPTAASARVGVKIAVGASRPATSKGAKAKTSADTLWKKYGSLRGDQSRVKERELIRNQLMVMYHPLVKYTAERMRTRLPSEVDVDDLMSAGVFGLMDAINSYDPSRGIKFETYCPQRVRGAIFDELRQMDWVPRLVRSRTSKMDRVRKQIEMSTGRAATNEELRSQLDVSAEEFEKINRDSRPVGIVSLNKKWADADSSGESREIDVAQDPSEADAFQMLQRQDLQTLLTKGLTRSERLIVILYYYEELTMKEIGVTLDLSESRVSQMHSSILARLKSQMKHRLKEVSGE